MANKADVFLDLNRRHANGGIYSSQYREALERLQDMPEPPQEPQKRLVITFTDAEGLRIEKPVKDPFSVEQRYFIRLAQYGLIAFIVLTLGLLQSCGCLF